MRAVTIKARPHYSRKVVFAELFSEVLKWGEDVGLSGLQMKHLIEGFTHSVTTTTQVWKAEDENDKPKS